MAMKLSLERWSLKDTCKMLDLLEASAMADRLKGTCADSKEYDNITLELNRTGVFRDAAQIKNKMKYLRKAYKHAKERPSYRRCFPFYEQMDRIYGANTQPLIISDVGTILEFEDRDEEEEEPSMTTWDESSADKAMSDLPLLGNIKVEELDESYEAESPQPQSLPSTSMHDSKRPLEKGNGKCRRKKAKINHFKDALEHVMHETTERILNFMKEMEEKSAQRTAEYRERVLAQNQEILDLLRKKFEK